MKIESLTAHNTNSWNEVLHQVGQYDFYHTALYHQLHLQSDQESAVLVVYSEQEKVAALPLIIRPLFGLAGIEGELRKWFDATSVYGYTGPITNHSWLDAAFTERFNAALKTVLDDLNIIAAFSRCHPIFSNHIGLTLGEIFSHGDTISIDLTLPADSQFQQYNTTHRYQIRKARKAGIKVIWDQAWQHYDDFLKVYELTMKSVNATDFYFFDRAYFDGLRVALAPCLHLFVVKLGEVVLGAGLFTLVNGIVQYHLSGTNPEYRKHASSKLLLDEVRLWAIAHNAYIFHLGGGVGSQADSLYEFKAAFSDRRHPFKTWRYIPHPEYYQQAYQQRRQWCQASGADLPTTDFFPIYRASPVSVAPDIPRVDVES